MLLTVRDEGGILIPSDAGDLQVQVTDHLASLLEQCFELSKTPGRQLVEGKEIFIRIPFSPDLQLVLVCFLVVQSIQIHQFDGGFDPVACLKSQIVRYVS